jgi:hypothetical protein
MSSHKLLICPKLTSVYCRNIRHNDDFPQLDSALHIHYYFTMHDEQHHVTAKTEISCLYYPKKSSVTQFAEPFSTATSYGQTKAYFICSVTCINSCSTSPSSATRHSSECACHYRWRISSVIRCMRVLSVLSWWLVFCVVTLCNFSEYEHAGGICCIWLEWKNGQDI